MEPEERNYVHEIPPEGRQVAITLPRADRTYFLTEAEAKKLLRELEEVV